MKEWIEKAKENSYSSKFTIEGSRMIRLLIAEIESLENLVADYSVGRLRNMELLQEKQELVDDYGQRLTKGNELLLKQHKKVEELEKENEKLELINIGGNSAIKSYGKTIKQLKQDYKILHTASDEVLKTIVWLCEHEPDNILIPQGLQAMCGCLQQALAKGE